MKRFLRAALSLLIVLGIVVALWPLGQAAYARWSQNNLRTAWREAATHPKSKATGPKRTNRVQTPARASIGNKAGTENSPATPSPIRAASRPREWPPTRIIAPDMGLDAVVVSGISESALRRGPGHWPGSALPGQPGNCVIAGHRNVYGSYFYRVDEMMPGSLITLRTPDDSFDYQVVQSYTVADTDVSVLQPPAQKNAPPQLTLITCTVRRTTTRIVITAQLVPPEEKL